MANIHTHAIIPAVVLRKLGASWSEVIAAAIGGAMPDLVSAFEHIMFWLGFVESKWVMRNYTHFIDQGAYIIPAIILAFGAILSTTYESAKPFWAAAAFIFGYGLHVVVDYAFHPPGGGWREGFIWIDIGFDILLALWFIVAWKRSHLTIKSFIRTL